jgi:primosomal protein N' (replication factor Y)
VGGQGALFDPPDAGAGAGRGRAHRRSDRSGIADGSPAGTGAVPAPGTVVRVVPDVRGMRQELDYLVPAPADADVDVGSLVDVEVGGRRLRAWVVALGVDPPEGVTLRPVLRLRSVGPDPAVTELTAWGAWRFAGARSALLGTASAPVLVRSVPAGDTTGRADEGVRVAAAEAAAHALGIPAAGLFDPGARVVRLPPATDPTPLVIAAARLGPLLVVTPTQARAGVVLGALRAQGVRVVGLPSGWASARGGGVSVVGTRVAAWAPCHPPAAVIVLDEHDEALSQEHTPTWHARTVAVERAARAQVPCLLVSPVPSLEALDAGPVVAPSRAVERAGWPILDVVDQRVADPLLPGLVSERLVGLLRGSGRVVCILNRTGRARLLACDSCESLARCVACGAAVGQDGSGDLVCRLCGASRPVVCENCGRTRLRTVRRGVSRVREDLEALVGERVDELTAAGDDPHRSRPLSRVVVGTTAALHRIERADVVAFLDFDQELTAASWRAAEDALGLLALAGRRVAPRSDPSPGRVLVQTSLPDHPVLAAARNGDPARFAAEEVLQRVALGWPPASAVALVSHAAAASYVAAIDAGGPGGNGVEVLGPHEDRWIVRAPDHATLCSALAAAPRPPGRLRIEVDPRQF